MPEPVQNGIYRTPMNITLQWDSSVSNAPSGFKTAVQAAATILDNQILNPVSVTINVGWGTDAGSAIPSNALATGGPQSVTVTYSQLVNGLTQAAQANNTTFLTSNLPSQDPTAGNGTWQISTAEAQALGIAYTPSSNDGNVGFGSSISWAMDASQGIGASQYDLISTALHEITHALGRINLPGGGYYDPLDLYTYSAPGTLNLTGTAPPAYFSVNGGTTNLNNFDLSSGGDPGDWATTLTDSFGPGPAGVAGPMTVTDWLVMESLGFHVAPTYILYGPTSVNVGAHDYLQLSTLNVSAGTKVPYSISGLTAGSLDSGTLSGTLTLGSNGISYLDLGLTNTATPSTVTVSLGSGTTPLATYTLTVNSGTNSVVDFQPGTTSLSTSGTGINETFQGTQANDAVLFSGASTDYVITAPATNTLQVQDPVLGRDGTSTLVGVDRLQFTDTSIAFDLSPTQSAGETAEIIGAAFGPSALSNATYVGKGINLFDSNQTMLQVAQLIVNDHLTPTGNSAFVSAIWNNLFGSAIDSSHLNTYVTLLDNQSTTQATLLAMAAALTANQTHINLAGLASTGIDYTPA